VFGLVRILDAANPSLLLSENVVEARNSATYELLVRELQRRNYIIQDIVLDERQAGSVEARTRWFFVAISKSFAEGFDIEQIAPQPRLYERIMDLLEAVPEDDPSWSDNAYLKDKAERDRAAGKGFANRALYTGEERSINTLRKFYNKRGSTDPMLAREDGKERLLTPIEHARAKGIPEALIADVGATLAHEGLGQSGLWGHFYGLARLIGEHLNTLEISGRGTVIEGNFSRGRRRRESERPSRPAQEDRRPEHQQDLFDGLAR
jgi:DNA (cytosine-5)-methyltransferase 1